MKLDRNISGNEGRGKYALLKLRALDTFREPGPFGGGLPESLTEAIKVLEAAGVIDWGDKPENEFFVVRLKDQYAPAALHSYAVAAYPDDREYSLEVEALAVSAERNPFRKKPD